VAKGPAIAIHALTSHDLRMTGIAPVLAAGLANTTLGYGAGNWMRYAYTAPNSSSSIFPTACHGIASPI
jgi:hypothetical protein